MRIIIEIGEGGALQAAAGVETLATAPTVEVQSAGAAAAALVEEAISPPPEPVAEVAPEMAVEGGIEDAGAAPELDGEEAAEVGPEGAALPEAVAVGEAAEAGEGIDAGGAPETLKEEETP